LAFNPTHIPNNPFIHLTREAFFVTHATPLPADMMFHSSLHATIRSHSKRPFQPPRTFTIDDSSTITTPCVSKLESDKESFVGKLEKKGERFVDGEDFRESINYRILLILTILTARALPTQSWPRTA
jgi:hypothetical protein